MAHADDQDAERAHIAAVGEAGATWWMEWIPASDQQTMPAPIDRGPFRIAS